MVHIISTSIGAGIKRFRQACPFWQIVVKEKREEEEGYSVVMAE